SAPARLGEVRFFDGNALCELVGCPGPYLVSPGPAGLADPGCAGLGPLRSSRLRWRRAVQHLVARPLSTHLPHPAVVVDCPHPLARAGSHRAPVFPQAQAQASERSEHLLMAKKHRGFARQRPLSVATTESPLALAAPRDPLV